MAWSILLACSWATFFGTPRRTRFNKCWTSTRLARGSSTSISLEREILSMGSSTRSPLSLMKRRTKWKKLLLSYMIAFWRVSALTQCLPCTPEAGMKENSTRNFQRLPFKADLQHKTGGIKLYLSHKKPLIKELPINPKNSNRLCSPVPSSKGWGNLARLSSKQIGRSNLANPASMDSRSLATVRFVDFFSLVGTVAHLCILPSKCIMRQPLNL